MKHLTLLALLLTAAAWVVASGSAGPQSCASGLPSVGLGRNERGSTHAASGTASRATRVYVNGLPLRQPALIKDGVTYVPLRAVAESLGCTVSYDQKAGVFIWGGQPSPQLPGLPSDGAAAPSPLPLDPRPVAPQRPGPNLP